MNGVRVLTEQHEVLLVEYACGALSESYAVLASAYISVCPEAYARFQSCTRIGGALMENCCDPVSMQEDSLRSVLERLDAPAARSPQPAQRKHAGPCPLGDCGAPAPVRRHVQSCPDAKVKWHSVAPGVEACRLPAADHNILLMMRAAPGARAPMHEHSSVELTLVLDGGYSDQTGHYHGGDLAIMQAGTRHAPLAGPHGFTVITVTETPVRFTEIWQRLARPW